MKSLLLSAFTFVIANLGYAQDFTEDLWNELLSQNEVLDSIQEQQIGIKKIRVRARLKFGVQIPLLSNLEVIPEIEAYWKKRN